MTLKTRILLLVAGTVVVLSAIVICALSLLEARDRVRAAQSDVHATSAVLSQFLNERTEALTDQLTLLARQPWLRPVILNSDSATITDCLKENLKQIHADSLLVTDADGRILGNTNGPLVSGHTVTRDAGVQAAIQDKIWSGVVAGPGGLMLAVTVPVTIGSYVCGTVTGYSAIDQDLAQSLKAALGADVAFVDQGRVIAASTATPARLEAPTGTPVIIRIGGRRTFALYGPLPDADAHAGIGFITLRSYDSLMAPYASGRLAFGLIFALACLIALVAGAGVAQSVTQPLRAVVQAAETLRQGQWPERLDAARADEIGLLQAVFNDMADSLRANQERLLALIDTDLLTGLDNHRRFQERLAQEAKRCAASAEPLCLLLIDLDHFHEFNQMHGHAAGDDALRRVAEGLLACVPELAIVARYGGEEFAVLLPQHTLPQAEDVAQKIQGEAFGSLAGEASKPLTASIGCAEFGAHVARAEALALAAELAVSQAKQLGRNQVCRFDSVPGAEQADDPYQLHKFLKDGSLATMQALAAAVDAKDPYTRGHSLSVAQYASALARHMGLPQETIDLVYTSGTLHDVGKIGVPDDILKKPGRLDEAERKIMETHPVLGEVIVRKAPQLAATLPAVRHHHERWDGSGYPDRLAGEAIPYIARILALADSFDAMTSDRPYRKGMPASAALAEIEKGAGAQFDPEMAQAFLDMMVQLDKQRLAA